MVNSVVIVGRVGQDPEMKYFESGKVRTSFSVAVNRWNARTKEQITDWFNVDVWAKQAEFAGEWVKKGALVSVEGRLAVNKWQGPDGEPQMRYLIVAQNINFVGSKREEN